MKRTLIAASLMTVLIAAAVAPAMAGDGEPTEQGKAQEKEERQAHKEKMKEEREAHKERMKEQREAFKERQKEEREAFKEKMKAERDAYRAKYDGRIVRGNVSLELEGTAVDKDGNEYTFQLSATGKGLQRLKDDDKMRTHARLAASIVLLDANGTVVKEGDVRMHAFARTVGNETKWIAGFRGEDGPKFVLKGKAEKVAPGNWDLEGRGKAVVGLDDERLKLRLSATGTFTFEPLVPPTTPPTPAASTESDAEQEETVAA